MVVNPEKFSEDELKAYMKILVENKFYTAVQVATLFGRHRSWTEGKLKKFNIKTSTASISTTFTKRLIQDLREKRYTRDDLERIFKCGHTLVSKCLVRLGFEYPRSTRFLLPDGEVEIVKKKHQIDRVTIAELARQYGVSNGAMTAAFKYYGIEKVKIEKYPHLSKLTKEELVDLNQNKNMSLPDIAEKYDAPPHAILRLFKKFDIDVKDVRKKDIDVLNDYEWMFEHHITQRKSCLQLAEELGCSASVINRSLAKLGIKAKMPSAVMDDRYHDYDWLYDQHINQQKNCQIIAEEIGCSGSTVIRKLSALGIPNMSHTYSEGTSSAERELFEYVCSIYDGGVISNDRTVLYPKELDIYIPELKLAIEYCGLYWHSEDQKCKLYHKQKLDNCNKKGIRLLTVYEDEWIHREEIVKRKIGEIIGTISVEKIYARECRVVDVPYQEVADFLDDHHIQGKTKFSYAYGLRSKKTDELVSVMCFVKRTDGEYELNRFATSIRVVGGFSKLLSYFVKTKIADRIISFADLRWSDISSNVYNKNGFVLDYVTEPDYSYIDWGKAKTIHKFSMRKKNLKKLLGEKYDENKTEQEMCRENGYRRIYNCGLAKYSLSCVGEK